MIYIQKDKEPDEIVSWKKKFKNKNKRKPCYEDIKSKPEKQQLKEALLHEQKYLCCYCCNRISDDSSHIEHFVPQSKDSGLSLEYSNLHASCQGENGDMKHCGHAKGNDYDKALLISPLDKNCEKRFAYSVNGKIEPSDLSDQGAEYTIKLLALNDERLKKAREEAMWTAGVFYAQGEKKRETLIKQYSNPADGKRVPFCNAILYQLRKDQESAGSK